MPDATAPSLQKKLPQIDPAAFYHFTTEVSAQASMLATHQQQLNQLASLTEEMVRALQGLRLQTTEAQAPPPNPPSQAPAPFTPTASSRLTFPEKFDGSPTKCKGFLLQCSMFVNQQPMLYPTDDCRIAFVSLLLTGRHWSGLPRCGVRIILFFFPSLLSSCGLRFSNIPLVERWQVSSCYRFANKEVWWQIMLSPSAHSQLKQDGWMILSD